MKRADCFLALAAWTLAAPLHAAGDRITVGSKNFAESRLLAEVFAQLVETRTELSVERKMGLAGTQVCFAALQNGDLDVYPEYTGTGLVTLLGAPPAGDATRTLSYVRREFLARWNLHWLAPLGFENSFEIAVPRALASAHHLRTISDLARMSRDLTAGFGHEFVQRDDGLPGLRRIYGLEFRAVKQLQQALQYQAAAAGDIQCLDVYTTDGRLVVHDLQVLEDDLDFFPPYTAAPLVRGTTLALHPELGAVLGLLGGSLDAGIMRRANLRVETRGETVESVARDVLADLGLVAPAPTRSAAPRRDHLAAFMWSERGSLARRTLEHVGLSLAGLVLGILTALPLGLWLERRRRIAEPVIRVLGITQTIPSLALLAFMIPLLGVGAPPAIAALWLYAIFPIVRNAYTGVRDADPGAVRAATALGMTERQVLRHVRLPLAVPVIMAGVRTAGVLTVGTATLAAFIGAGGLGEPIVSGVQSVDTIMILSGALPAAALAVVADVLLGRVERGLQPRGLRGAG